MPAIEELSLLVDEATAAYILENHRYFEDLKQVASQLAGLLVLAAAGSNSGLSDHPMLESARQLFREAGDAVRRARPTERARRHYQHLAQAATLIGAALNETPGSLNIHRILIPLRAGYSELERAADSLPGFEKVAYERACCGARTHGR
ncbi:MAG: hypothetical protein JOZ32_11525 [Bryobacterales bacterium]|nr:hypothetical protein [Bryobacterales bacterium]